MRIIVVGILCLGVFLSCSSISKVKYFEDLNSFDNIAYTNSNVVFKQGDLLSVMISSPQIELSQPYNLPVASFSVNSASVSGQPQMQTYLVRSDGNITLPIIGEVYVLGKTKKEVIADLTEKIGANLSDYIIIIRIMNFKITVLGEVNRPGVFKISNESVTLLEALGLAGDMTIYAKRKEVKIIRDNGIEKQVITVDFNSKDLFKSKAYYLSQNDVVYISPNRAKSGSSLISGATSLLLSSLSFLVTLISLFI
ncbi:MAG: polysaccharide biosynthesis/export family protein [Flavobacteriaceae bacterium]|nr:polysaccharide biosynthesis/export family protein [Flavobacteriaceae bacterium]